MSIRKALLLATMAIAAVAFAAPAGASASGHFTMEEAAITEPVNTEFTGTIGFESTSGSYECEAHASATIETESGTLDTLAINKEDCLGTGAFAHCKLNVATLTSGATLTPTSNGLASDIDLNNFKLTNVFETGYPGTGSTSATTCTVAGLPLELTFANGITLTPNNHAAISSLVPSGGGVLEIEPSTVIAAVSAYGSLNTVEGQEGTIGIST